MAWSRIPQESGYSKLNIRFQIVQSRRKPSERLEDVKAPSDWVHTRGGELPLQALAGLLEPAECHNDAALLLRHRNNMLLLTPQVEQSWANTCACNTWKRRERLCQSDASRTLQGLRLIQLLLHLHLSFRRAVTALASSASEGTCSLRICSLAVLDTCLALPASAKRPSASRSWQPPPQAQGHLGQVVSCSL